MGKNVTETNWDQQRKEIVRIGSYIWQQHLVAGIDGNISVKLNSDNLMITPGGRSLNLLSSDDMVVVDFQTGQPISKQETKASSEVNLHISSLQANDDIKAVIHTHPPYATALGIISKGIIEPTLTNLVIQFGSIPVVPYETPGSKQIGYAISNYAKQGYRAMILEHHGVISLGQSLLDAYFITEQIEHLSKTILIAQQSGIPKCITKKDIAKLMELRKRFSISAAKPLLSNRLACARNETLRRIGRFFKFLAN